MRHRFFREWGDAGLYLFLFLFAAAGVFTAATLVRAAAAPAPDEDTATELEKVVPLPDEPPPTLEDAPEPAASGDQSATGPSKKPQEEETYLGWMYRSLGLFYSIVFLALSFTLVALVVMNLLTARRENVVPLALVEGFEAQLNEKRYQEAYEMAKSDESFLGQVLSAGLAKLSSGYAQAIEAMQEVGEEENMKLEHKLSYMALIGTISPMIGLLGTVQGMIDSFSTIAARETTPPPRELAGGISTALFTTLVGLFIAIPAIAMYNILRNRIARLVLEVGIVSEGLMSRFSNVGTKKG